jgi:hypothetical protein
MSDSYRVGQRLLLDGWREVVVCDVREDGTVYATAGDNERILISDKGVAMCRVETQVAGRCKCMAATFEDHKQKVWSGEAGAHVYTGFFWQTQNTSRETE